MKISPRAVLGGALLALAACSDPVTTPATESSPEGPSFDVSALTSGMAMDLGTGETFAPALDVGAEQAATGGRASGHAEVQRVLPNVTIADEYSFIALSTEPSLEAPFLAKGEFNSHQELTTSTGVIERSVHADIDCLRIMGNTAVVSGPVERFISNGQSVVLPPGLQVVFTVQDLGEGRNSPPDRASPYILILLGRPVPACQVVTLATLEAQKANIQVEQR